MKIEYVLFASFAALMPVGSDGKPCELEVDAGTRVDTLMERLKLPKEKAKIIFVNGIKSSEDTLLSQGDRVGIFPIVAGG